MLLSRVDAARPGSEKGTALRRAPAPHSYPNPSTFARFILQTIEPKDVFIFFYGNPWHSGVHGFRCELCVVIAGERRPERPRPSPARCHPPFRVRAPPPAGATSPGAAGRLLRVAPSCGMGTAGPRPLQQTPGVPPPGSTDLI